MAGLGNRDSWPASLMSLTVVAGIVLPMRRRSLLAALISLPIALSACGESKPQDPTAALAKAKTTFDTAKAVTIIWRRASTSSGQ